MKRPNTSNKSLRLVAATIFSLVAVLQVAATATLIQSNQTQSTLSSSTPNQPIQVTAAAAATAAIQMKTQNQVPPQATNNPQAQQHKWPQEQTTATPTRQLQMKRDSSSTIRATSKKVAAARAKQQTSGAVSGAKTTPNPATTKSSSDQAIDPLAWAQEQARLMLGYNNTPPLFITRTRDFFVDVSRYSLGTRLTTINAFDEDGDAIDYSLQPSSSSLHDASPYFAIDAATGELRLAHKPLVISQHLPSGRSIGKAEDADDEERADEDEANDESEDTGQSDSQPNHESVAGRNLYFLNVVANDGRYSSVLELKIHVVNGSLPVQLTLEGSRRASEQLDSVIRNKSIEFYDKLHRISIDGSAADRNINRSPAVVYPNFVNPSLVRPEFSQPQDTQQHETHTNTLATSTMPSTNAIDIPITDFSQHPAQTPVIPSQQHSVSQSEAGFAPDRQKLDVASVPQPMVVSLVIICSCMTIALVLLIFIVPISVKRLRRRLKHVERQHEQLSHQSSNGSTTICSSSGSSSSIGHHKHDGVGCSSLSQFTLASDRSCTMGRSSSTAVCRQFSLGSDSMATVMSPPHQSVAFLQQRQLPPALNSANNSSIANPLYLDQNQQQQNSIPYQLRHQLPVVATPAATGFSVSRMLNLQAQQAHPYHVREARQPHLPFTAPLGQHQQQAIDQKNINQESDEIYYPLDDEFYSTITTESTILEDPNSGVPLGAASNIRAEALAQCKSQVMNNYQEMCELSDDRPIGSPNSDSGSSVRSLARFLSLPARHSAHTQADCAKNHQEMNKDDDDFQDHDGLNFTSRTIARASQVDREQNHHHNWEIERHKLRFVDIIDEGQFGLVCRYRLTLANRREQVVAVKTLKNSALKDKRGRDELLAEIEVMKLVCNHPNVVRILHCCTKDATTSSLMGTAKPILLVMEYVELGKLQSYLEKSRINHHYATNLYNNYHNNHLQDQAATPTSDCQLTSRDLIKFIYHIAKGMEYVSSSYIVHRDLASRNILVNSQRVCKIGDFGMARHMQSSSGVYERRQSHNTKIPVRWMAPEVLLNNSFTTKSDVFSFGILMWEIVTLGSTPYRHLKTEEVVEEVARNGQRPDKPPYCHSQLYKIMSRCWSDDPSDRPTFSWLVKQLDEILLSANDYIELDQYPDHNYYNISKNSAPYELL